MWSSRGLKQAILGPAVVGLSMMLAIASLAWVMLDIAPYLVNSPSRPGGLAGIVMLLAVFTGLGGLMIVYWGTMRDD